tara:strand:- start:1324 stop:3492 length:2169 start_codon:yes stop_codon:yes gene_type:complete
MANIKYDLRDALMRRMRNAEGQEVLVRGGPEAERAFAETQLLQKQLKGNSQDKLGAAWEQASRLAADRIRQNEQNALAQSKQSADVRQRQAALNLDRQTAESKARLDAGNLQLRARDSSQRNQLAAQEAKQRADYQQSSIGLQERSANFRETAPMDERATSLLKQARGMKLTDDGRNALARLSSAYSKIQAKRSSLRPAQYNQLMSQWMDQFESSRLHNLVEQGPASIAEMMESGRIQHMGGGSYWRLNDDGSIDTLQGGDGASSELGVRGTVDEMTRQFWGDMTKEEFRKEYEAYKRTKGNENATIQEFYADTNARLRSMAQFEKDKEAMAAGVFNFDVPPSSPTEVEPASPSNRSASTNPVQKYQGAQSYIRGKQIQGVEPYRGAVLPPARNLDGSVINLPPTYSPEQMAAAAADPRSTMRQDTKDYDYDAETGQEPDNFFIKGYKSFWEDTFTGPPKGESNFRKVTKSTQAFRKKPARSKMIAANQQYMADLKSAFGGEGSPTDGGKSALALEQALSELPVESRPSMQGMIDDFALERAVQLGYENPAKHLLDAATRAAQSAKKRKGGGARKTPSNYLLMTEMEKQQYRSTPQFKMSDINEMQTSQLPDFFFDENFDLHVSKASFDKKNAVELQDSQTRKVTSAMKGISRPSSGSRSDVQKHARSAKNRSGNKKFLDEKRRQAAMDQGLEDYREGKLKFNPFSETEKWNDYIEKLMSDK